MIEIRLLGGLDVRAQNRDQARSVLVQPRRAALLVYLAVRAPEGLERRDRLAALFWPDADPSAARQSLRQALAFIRRALGDDVFITDDTQRGSEAICIDPRVVQCDVPDFDRMIADGQPARAAELYAGEFLAGFGDVGVAGFDRWREATADRLRQRAASALRTLSEEARAANNAALAAHWARRELALDPADEVTVAHTMRAVAATGDSTGATEIYERFERLLAHEFDEEPPEHIRELAQALRGAPVAKERAEVPSLYTTDITYSTEDYEAVPARPSARSYVPHGAKRLVGVAAMAVIGVVALSQVGFLRGSARRTADSAGNRRSVASGSSLAVMPFRVADADSSLGYLRHGVVELLVSRLHGIDGAVVDPVTASKALDAARRLGVQYFVTGAVVGSGGRVVIDATLRLTRNDSVLIQASEEARADSVAAITDHIAERILFVRGQIALRAGLYTDALQVFEQLLDSHPASPQFALGLAIAGRRLGSWYPWQRGLRTAWHHRAELGRGDSLYLVALTGPRYPAVPTHAELLEAWERVTEEAPTRAESWFELGDALLAWGPVIGVADPPSRARAALGRALQLDSSMTGAVIPLLDASMDVGDTATVRALATRYFGQDATGESIDYGRWRLALFFGNASELRAVRRRFDKMSNQTLLQIVGMSQVDGLGSEDGERALAVLEAHAGSNRERQALAIVAAQWALNHGRAADAVRARRLAINGSSRANGDYRALVLDAMYGGGDTVAARDAVRELDSRDPRATASDARGVSDQAAAQALRASNLCVTEQWRAWHGQGGETDAVIRLLLEVGRPELRACATLVAAIDGARQGRQDAPARLDSLDLQLRSGDRPGNDEYYGNIALARMWEERGEAAKALAVIRRRPHNHWEGPWYLRQFLATEKRLAARVGDRAAEARTAKNLDALR
jgi:DNA-binding SARP family transcriptional activator/TolB-like protein